MKQLYASGNCIVNIILTYSDLIVFLKRKQKTVISRIMFF